MLQADLFAVEIQIPSGEAYREAKNSQHGKTGFQHPGHDAFTVQSTETSPRKEKMYESRFQDANTHLSHSKTSGKRDAYSVQGL